MQASLVNGFIRSNERQLFPQIIPNIINELCFLFYYSTQLLFYLSELDQENPQRIYIADAPIQTNNPKKYKGSHWFGRIYDTPKSIHNRSLLSSMNNWRVEKTAFVYQKNVHFLPKHISQTINECYNKHHNVCIPNNMSNFQAIFQCGGGTKASKKCNAFLFSEMEHQTLNKQHQKHIIGYNWILPDLPYPIHRNYILLSERHGLLSFGGIEGRTPSDKICSLQFDYNTMQSVTLNAGNDDIGSWKWSTDSKMQMNVERADMSVIEIPKTNAMLIIGGFSDKDGCWTNATEIIYEFGSSDKCIKKKFVAMNRKRECCGVVLSDLKDTVYVCGGDGFKMNTVEYCDLNKQKWLLLKNTNFKHDCYPAMWFDVSQNILFVASSTSGKIEFVDLRNHKSKWNIGHSLPKMMRTDILKGLRIYTRLLV